MADGEDDAGFTTVDEALIDGDSRMGKAIEALRRELNTLRTGRATPALLENLTVDYYGAPTPLNQIAAVSAPEARLIVVQPWDKQALREIEKSLLKSEMGFNPANDGNVIRVPIPALSQDRRQELVRLLKRKVGGRQSSRAKRPKGRPGASSDHGAGQGHLPGRESQGPRAPPESHRLLCNPNGPGIDGQRGRDNGGLRGSFRALL